jgi:V/A-type H+/Na+-transporting ATPase subunit E
MDAQAILTKIEQDAKDAAQKVLADAQAKAKLMKLEAEARIEAQEKTMLRQAEQDGDQMEERMKRMADLDDRKAMLQMKRETIDSAFRKAMEKLAQTKPADRRAFYLAQVAKLAGGEETLIAGANADYFDDGFLADANKALEKAGKPGKLQLQAQRREGCDGVVLSQNGAEVRITFDTLLDEARADMEQIAAHTLFTE